MCKKIPYETKVDAISDIKLIKRNMRRRAWKSKRGKDNKKFHAYLCDRCNRWHISTMSKKDYRRKANYL